MQYARECLTLDRRLKRLASEHGYFIRYVFALHAIVSILPLTCNHSFEFRKAKLKQLNAQFNIPSSRKPPPFPIAQSHICEKMAQDIHRRNGPTAIKHQLAVEGIIIPR